jgi:hypothetical protein
VKVRRACRQSAQDGSLDLADVGALAGNKSAARIGHHKIPPRKRVLMMDVIDHSGGRPRIELTFMPLGEAAVGTLAATPVEFIRHKHHLKDRSDGFILQFIDSGPIHFTHVSEERTYDAGWAHFVDQERPLRGFGPRHASIRNIAVRAAALRPLAAHPEDLAGHRVHPGPALRLLDGYL